MYGSGRFVSNFGGHVFPALRLGRREQLIVVVVVSTSTMCRFMDVLTLSAAGGVGTDDIADLSVVPPREAVTRPGEARAR